MTMGDIKTNSKSNGANTWVSGWNPDSDALYFIDTGAKMSQGYVFIPQWKIDEDAEWEGYDAGWYNDETWECLNDEPLPFGSAIIIKAYSADIKDANPQILVSGQVKDQDKDIPVSKFIVVPNCSPTRVYLGKITTNSESDGYNTWTKGWNPDADALYFIDSTAKMSQGYVYIPQWKIEQDSEWEGYDAGWYNDETWECLNDTHYIDPGCGVIIKAYSAVDKNEPVITIPSALSK